MATGKAKPFQEAGVATSLAVEIAKQITSGLGDARRLKEFGMVPTLAAYVAKCVVSHTASIATLTELGWPARVVREFVKQVKS